LENQKLSPQLKEYVESLVKEAVSKKVPHICSYCALFQFSENRNVPRNRYCQFKGDLKLMRGICQMWILAEDVGLRVRGNYTV